jgi:regulator of sirC expression with transglutaminase-like and TPR domain
VLDRRTGIPITLSVVYMETARRAGLQIDGINFPGHFLVRCPDLDSRSRSSLIIDPFHGGALLSEHDCRLLLQRHVGSEVAFNKSLLAPTTRPQIIARMLLNLKRIYVHMRSFPQARDVTELLLAITPSALSELRDRGLLAYHLNDVTGALRDLQMYLKLASWSDNDKESREEHEQIWEHVKTLRRRVAGLN